MQWRRACENSACVEVARLDDGAVLIRDSKDPDTVVVFSADAWSAFTAGVRAGKFVLVIGETARARKGTARANVARLMRHVDGAWATSRTVSGLSSGEGLIAAVADQGGER